MLPLAELPPGYTPGAFYYLDYGIFMVPSPFDIIFFSGLQHHGASPPRAPENTPVENHACRINIVAYPNIQTVRGLGPVPLGPLGSGATGGALLSISPEVRHRYRCAAYMVLSGVDSSIL